MDTVKKFLEFNGKSILFIARDGQYWVAIKPICEALNVNYDRQYRNLTSDPFLGQLCAEQHMVAADGKLRKMTSIPEKYVYGWIFTIQTSSPDHLAYKGKCYELLYDYFHGTIGKRTPVLKTKTQAEIQIEKLEAELMSNPAFVELLETKTRVTQINKELRNLDNEVISNQLDLWKQDL